MQEEETQLELALEEGFQRLIAHGLVRTRPLYQHIVLSSLSSCHVVLAPHLNRKAANADA